MFKKLLGIMLVVILAAVGLTGCGNTEDDDAKGTVKLAYVSWLDTVAITHLAAVVLEDKMGYEVELTLADIAPVLASVANGSTDAYLEVWLPYTHKSYMDKYGDDMVDLGVIYEGARCGLVVPSYVEINSIEELNDSKELFDGVITGIDPGAGIMESSAQTIEEYNLDYTVQSGSETTMTAALSKAINNNEPIVVTGWAPHWKFARWDLKFLEDPKLTFGESEICYKFSRIGLEEDMPEVVEFIKNFRLTAEDVAEMMGALEEDAEDPKAVARDWMNAHEELVNSWLPE